MDASEMLDMGAYDSEDDDESADSAGSGDSDDDSDEEMDSASASSASEVDEEYEGALDKLSSFVEGLESSKKRKVDDEAEGGKKKKRVVLKERTEAYPEGEFVAVGAKDGEADGELSLRRAGCLLSV